VLGENLPQCSFVHHKPHMLSGREAVAHYYKLCSVGVRKLASYERVGSTRAQHLQLNRRQVAVITNRRGTTTPPPTANDGGGIINGHVGRPQRCEGADCATRGAIIASLSPRDSHFCNVNNWRVCTCAEKY
jgi:hypothetical protein